MNEIHIAPLARDDLTEIKRYIGRELENPIAARSVVNLILHDITALQHHAHLGTPLGAIAAIDGGYRYLVCGSYLVFYRIDGQDVYVDRILYGRRDYLRILLGDDAPKSELN